MLREMRRKKQALAPEECSSVLAQGTSGVLALSGSGGCPYAVPLSYVFDGDRRCFPCAKAGYELDVIRQNSHASFCVVGQDQIVPEAYTTCFPVLSSIRYAVGTAVGIGFRFASSFLNPPA